MTMKVAKALVLVVSMGLVSTAFADELVGNWQTYDDGQPKAVVKISESDGTYTGIIISGNTEKAKEHVGKTVMTGLKADGNGKYSSGRITDPTNGKSYRLTATLNGNTLSLKGHLGPFSRTQTWKKQ